MSYLSRNDIEQIAARVTRDYKCLPRFQGQVVEHIDPEILACELCGLHLDYFHLSRDGLTLGMTSDGRVEVPVIGEDGELILFFLDGATILIEKDLKNAPEQRGRYNFTLMHETSHQILYGRSRSIIGSYLIGERPPDIPLRIGANGKLTAWLRPCFSRLIWYGLRSRGLAWKQVYQY